MLQATFQKHAEKIRSFQYHHTNDSLVEPLLIKFWWVPIQSNIPPSITPNAITITGLIAFYILFAIHYFVYENYYLLAAGLFIFQTTDCIDGIHARNTKQSSPLGMVLDHASDALTLIPWMLGALQAINCINNPYIVLTTIANCLINANTWDIIVEYKRTAHLSEFDITEFQLVTILVFILTQTFGQDMWTHYYLGYIIGAIISMVSFFDIYGHIMEVMQLKNYAKWKYLFQLEILHVCLLVSAMLVWYSVGEMNSKLKLFMFWNIIQCYFLLLSVDTLIKTVINMPKIYMDCVRSGTGADIQLYIIPPYFYLLLFGTLFSIWYNTASLMIVSLFIGVYTILYVVNAAKTFMDTLNVKITPVISR